MFRQHFLVANLRRIFLEIYHRTDRQQAQRYILMRPKKSNISMTIGMLAGPRPVHVSSVPAYDEHS
jgi:hypothetical protein